MSADTESQVHETRRKFLGGSDIAALYGNAPRTWRRSTPVALYYDKIAPPVAEAANRREKRRGKVWESVVAEMLVDELQARGHHVEVLGNNRRFIDAEHDFFACEIDYEVRLDHEPDVTNVELKTVHPFRAQEWGDSETDDAPDWYIGQAMWGLGITGRKRCILAPLFGADQLKVFWIERDEETIAAMRDRARKFWVENVLQRVPPEPLALDDLTLLHPQATEETLEAEGNNELMTQVLRLRAVDRELKARQGEFDVLEFQIKSAMRDHAELTVMGKSAITWRARPHTFLDQTALKEKAPDIHRKFTRKGSSRVFALKSFAWN
jgi:predicted phage-related endonuclease